MIRKDKMMKAECVYEHNGNDTLLYCASFIGAFTRGGSKEEALSKMGKELRAYMRWSGEESPGTFEPIIVQEKASELQIRDADSDVIFETERLPLTPEEYERLKRLALKSAEDFLRLYESVPDKHKSALQRRATFYGELPTTAYEMYEHTKNVNSYYFGEIGVEADNVGTIRECRERGFAALEKTPDFLNGGVVCGSCGELWSLAKVLRRFIWHDRIHAKAMFKMAMLTFGEGSVDDAFRFGE